MINLGYVRIVIVLGLLKTKKMLRLMIGLVLGFLNQKKKLGCVVVLGLMLGL